MSIYTSVCAQGKSLSLICGALKWLTDCEQRDREREEQILAGKPTGTASTPAATDEADSGRSYTTTCLYSEWSVRCKGLLLLLLQR